MEVSTKRLKSTLSTRSADVKLNYYYLFIDFRWFEFRIYRPQRMIVLENLNWIYTARDKSWPNLKACVCYLLSNFYFSPTITLQKLWKMFFISSKKLFSLSSSLFLPVNHCFRGWSKINLKVYGIINCLNKNLITHFVWYLGKEKSYDVETLSIDRVLNKENFFWKIRQEICTKS